MGRGRWHALSGAKGVAGYNPHPPHDVERATVICYVPETCGVYTRFSLGSNRATVAGIAMVGFPQRYLNHGKTLGHREIIDEARDVLGRWIHIHDEHGLGLLTEVRQYWVVAVQQHAVVEGF